MKNKGFIMELLTYIINFIYTIQSTILMGMKDFFGLFLPEIIVPFVTIFVYFYIPVIFLSRKLFNATILELLPFWGLYFYVSIMGFITLFLSADLSLNIDYEKYTGSSFIVLFMTAVTLSGVMRLRGEIWTIRRGFESRYE
jgi:hypothetical protein